MKIIATKRMGEATFQFEFEGTDLKDALFKASFLMDKDDVWGAGMESFKGRPVWYKVRKTKEGDLIYVERKCRDEAGRIASSNLGTYKQGGYFWHAWEIYDPNTASIKKVDDNDF
jgi:hypothetical protein